MAMDNDSIELTELLCEYVKNPIGIDIKNPRFTWNINIENNLSVESKLRIIVSSSEYDIRSNFGDMWDSGYIFLTKDLSIEYRGNTLESGHRYFWKVCYRDSKGKEIYSSKYFFEMGLLKESDWEGSWIMAPFKHSNPLFKKVFNGDKAIKSARAYVCGLGYFNFYINGEKVGDQVLAPNWTDYDKREMKDLLYFFDDNTTKRVLYLTFDISKLLKHGTNEMLISLGNGWYNQIERNVEGKLNYDLPKFIAQINIEYEDGTEENIYSNESWETKRGKIVYNNIYVGEVYDATKDSIKLGKEENIENKWVKVINSQAPKGTLKAQFTNFDKVVSTINPKMIKSEKHMKIFDMGENISGWVKIMVEGQFGDTVTIRYSEEINENNELDFESCGGKSQIQKDVYILNGSGIEEYEPSFTWHGFRYAEVNMDKDRIQLISIQGRVVHTDVMKKGSFSCSEELFNDINKAYIRTQLNNMHGGVPSDCPHRERLGYTGDAHVTAESAIYNFDMGSFYSKWLNDVKDAQNKVTGYVPHTVPFYGGGGGPGWGSAYVLIPWYMYLYYGDKRIIREHYEGMKAWVDYLCTKTSNGFIVIREEPRGWCLGDWCTPETIKLPECLVNTYFLFTVSQIMAKIARILGKEEDFTHFNKLVNGIKQSFNDEFYNKEKGCYSIGCQGSDVFPLAAELVEEEEKSRVLENLINNITEKNNYHLDTGIFGTPLLFKVLTDNGFDNLAYDLLKQKDFPSYGYMLENGATTLWENFNGNDSHDHPMFGSISAWFYKEVVGINIDEGKPGYENIIIKPHLTNQLKYAEAKLNTIRGKVEVNWKKNLDSFNLYLKLPCGSSATIYVPKISNDDSYSITINNRLINVKEIQDVFNYYSIEIAYGGEYTIKITK